MEVVNQFIDRGSFYCCCCCWRCFIYTYICIHRNYIFFVSLFFAISLPKSPSSDPSLPSLS